MLAQYTKTEKGKPMIVADGFMYTVRHMRNDITTWRCQNCSCKVKGTGNSIQDFVLFGEHEHEKDDKKCVAYLI
jgi:hypothetical protein